jgi:hypothetical protein
VSSAPRGNPIFVPLDVSRRGHRRSCIEKGDWVAYPVDLQGKKLLGTAWPELQRLCIDPIRYNHADPGPPYRGRLDDDATMTVLRHAKNRTRAMTVAPRVGLVGLLGHGNLGNDGSLETVLDAADSVGRHRSCPPLSQRAVRVEVGESQ